MKKFLLAICALTGVLHAQVVTTFQYTGAMQTFTVPACVTEVTITVYGAQGEDALVGGATGGAGGSATGTLNVTTGQTLNIFVGGQSGYNGGGQGGINGNDANGPSPIGTNGGHGGGASDVRVGGVTVNDRVIVAGGGGGAGHNGVWQGCQTAGPGGNGGSGGGLTGGNGTFGVGFPCNCGGGGGDGGTGGTQSAGGLGGGYYGSTNCLRSTWAPGQDGTLAQGGVGGLNYYNGSGGGGGGGGGYYGGGSGANGSDTTPGGGGGGGSSWTGTLTSPATTAGVRTGNGMIVITYSLAASLPTAPVNFSGDNAVCPGATITYSIDPVATATSYTWTVPGGWTILSGQGTTTVTVVVGSSTDTIWAAAINNCGTGTASPYEITVYPPPVVDLGADTTFCGTSILLDAENPGSTYQWSNSASGQTTTAVVSGPIDVIVTDANGCVGYDTINITINTPPTVTASAATNAVCLPADTIQLFFSPSGGIFTGPGVIGNEFDPMAAGSGVHDVVYSYSDLNGCIGADTVTITVNAPPTVVASAAMNFVCLADDTVQLFGSPSGGIFSGPGVTIDEFDPAAAGVGTHDIIYGYTDANGCIGADTTTITVDVCTGIISNDGLTYTVHPNPATTNCAVTFSVVQEEVRFELRDVQGRIVKMQKEISVNAGTPVVLDLSGIAPGMYVLHVISGEKESVQKLQVK